jgi:hypothetical protein
MKRRVIDLLTLLSLLLLVAVCVLWVRSYSAHDAVGWFYRHADAVRYERYREEKRLVVRFRGVESVRGAAGAGGFDWEQAKRSPAVFALEWTPLPDEDRLGYHRVVGAARPGGGPFAAAGTQEHGALGFRRVEAVKWPPPGRLAAVVVPDWFLALATALLPAARAGAAARRFRRRRHSRCEACGYDLRATPGRCPECGAGAGPASAA